MENNKILLIFLSLLIYVGTYAQDTTDKKKEFNEIKKSQEYIYGQCSGTDEQKCQEIAYEDFLANLKEYITSEKELSEATAVILDQIKKGVKQISFERYLNCKVVCIYIKKEDIKPLYKKDFINPQETPVPIIINTVVSTDTIVKDTVVAESKESMPEIVPDSEIESTLEIMPDSEMEHTPEIVSEPKEDPSMTIIMENEKESSIINDIVTLKDFSKITAYLENRKTANHDVIYKTAISYGNIVNAYWIVFNKNRTVIAILTKDRTLDLMTNKAVRSGDYVNSPKIWIQIY